VARDGTEGECRLSGDGFNKTVLPHNSQSDYLPLYLYSLYQKYQLFAFADELMRKGAYVSENLQEVRKLMDRFMNFSNRYWFNEVTRKPLGGEIYRKFQQGLESTSLYEMVSAQVKDLKEYYEERRQRRTGVLLNLFTFAFIPLSAVIGVFGMTFFEKGNWGLFLATFIVVGSISLGLWRWWTEESGPRGR
jgi:Mg2+ and Co2+ transporter CorA